MKKTIIILSSIALLIIFALFIGYKVTEKIYQIQSQKPHILSAGYFLSYIEDSAFKGDCSTVEEYSMKFAEQFDKQNINNIYYANCFKIQQPWLIQDNYPDFIKQCKFTAIKRNLIKIRLSQLQTI